MLIHKCINDTFGEFKKMEKKKYVGFIYRGEEFL